MGAFGFLNLNKPAGWTSHDCVAKVRRLLKMKRVGHGGTLDPAATGVLPIALGRATRLLQFLPGEKAYRARCRLGVQTTTDDLEGEAIACPPLSPAIDLAEIRTALHRFVGCIEQVPPVYSAIQRDGRRLYARARAGETDIVVPPRQVEIQSIDIISWMPGPQPELELEIVCGPGTYIRAIARDLGTALGTGGTLAALTRTHSCGFSLAASTSFTELEAQITTDAAANFAPIAPALALGHLPRYGLETVEGVRYWQQGRALTATGFPAAAVVCVLGPDGAFLGIGMADGTGAIAPRVVIPAD